MPANKGVKVALDLIQEDPSKILGLSSSGHVVEKSGQYIKKKDAQQPPEMTFNLPDPTKKYIVIGIDIDAPFQSLPILGPILHWIQGGFTSTDGKLTTTEPFVVNYIAPAPPPGSGAHRYCFLLYEQPEGFDVKKHAPANGAKTGNGARMWFSLDEKVKEFGLGEVVAFNYFTSN